MQQLLSESPIEPIDELHNPMRLVQLPTHIGRTTLDAREMVDVHVEVDLVGEVIGGGERAEAAGEGIEAVEGEDLDDEGEVGVGVLSSDGEAGIGGVEGERGVVVGVEEEGGDRDDDERDKVPSGSHHLWR